VTNEFDVLLAGSGLMIGSAFRKTVFAPISPSDRVLIAKTRSLFGAAGWHPATYVQSNLNSCLLELGGKVLPVNSDARDDAVLQCPFFSEY